MNHERKDRYHHGDLETAVLTLFRIGIFGVILFIILVFLMGN